MPFKLVVHSSDEQPFEIGDKCYAKSDDDQ